MEKHSKNLQKEYIFSITDGKMGFGGQKKCQFVMWKQEWTPSTERRMQIWYSLF